MDSRKDRKDRRKSKIKEQISLSKNTLNTNNDRTKKGQDKKKISPGLSENKNLAPSTKGSNKSAIEVSSDSNKNCESYMQFASYCDNGKDSKHKSNRKGNNKKTDKTTKLQDKHKLSPGSSNTKTLGYNTKISNKSVVKVSGDLKKKNCESYMQVASNYDNFNGKNSKHKYNRKGINKDACSYINHSDTTNIKIYYSKDEQEKVDGKISEKNMSFDDIEKKIFENSPHTKKISRNIKSKKNTVLNKQLHQPTFRKISESKKSRSSKKISCTSLKKTSNKNININLSKTQEKDSSDESEWEDIDELNEILKCDDDKSNRDIQIELQAENPYWGITKRKRRNEREKIEDYLRKEINKSIREVQENVHKTHLLCLLAHGLYVNQLLCSEILTSCALSIIPKQYYSPKRIDINHLERFVNWFYSHIKIKNTTELISQEIPDTYSSESVEDKLIKRFETKSPTCTKEMVLMFVATSRAVGMTVRYIQSLTPVSWKPPVSNLIKPKKETNNNCNENIVTKSMKMLSSDSETDLNDKDFKRGKKKKKSSNSDEDSDYDFDISSKFRGKHGNVLHTKKLKTGDKNIEGNEKHNANKRGIKDWAEIYLEEEEKWIPVDVIRNQIHCANEIAGRTWNLSYVIAFNPDNTVKDVTKRYMSSWLSYKDKVRLDNKWWSDSLRPFLTLSDKRDQEEEREMDENLKLQPLPKAINKYKNHPLYALQRHLLKFEAIYPPNASPVGFFKGEPVYPRECVKILNGREKWINEAKTVRVNEEPYKVVKARPKWDRSTCQLIKDKSLELFGEWQVEDYVPPIARNGRVPRNEYGNVELFKPSMLPVGCVLLPINGLNRVARKIDIDCAPAVTGFDYHSGSCHPVYGGFVVCEEFKDILLDAWNQDQVEQAKKQEEKRIKRIYDNWKRLINGVTLKERLQSKYGISSQGVSKLANEKCSRKKKTVEKIKQEDLNQLPASVITHAVPTARIDFESSVTDALKKKRSVKRKLVSNEKKNKNYNDTINESSDSEDLSDTEKRKKIRSILDWNPNVHDNQSDPALSDNSDEESDVGEHHLKNSSIMLTPVSESNSAKKSKPSSTKSNKSSKKSSMVNCDVKSSAENKELPDELPVKRRSLRARNRKQNYKEGEKSSSDISIGDSDTGDATYHPTSE